MYKNLINVALFSTMLSVSADAFSRVELEETEQKAHAEESSNEAEWDVLNPPFNLNEVTINTDETTWSSLDVSPNGEKFVFDMLGDLYISPIAGGEATSLTQDFAWNIQPTFSPDGKKIAFISDRGGMSNVWVMNSDGSNLVQVTKEKNNLIHSPKWSPDGQYIVANKGIMSSRSIPAGEIWLYHHLSLIHI